MKAFNALSNFATGCKDHPKKPISYSWSKRVILQSAEGRSGLQSTVGSQITGLMGPI